MFNQKIEQLYGQNETFRGKRYSEPDFVLRWGYHRCADTKHVWINLLSTCIGLLVSYYFLFMKKEELKPTCFGIMENGQGYLPCRDLSSVHLREEVDAIYPILF